MKVRPSRASVRQSLAVLVCLSVLLAPSPVIAKLKKTPPTPLPTAKIDPYQRAKEELPPNYAALYIIVERLARANSLDSKPWRILATSNSQVNAFATDYNLLVFEAGLLDQLEGNPSAIACAVGHEMGHHIKQHLGYGPEKVRQATLEEIRKAEQDKLVAQQDAETKALLAKGVAAGAGAAVKWVDGAAGDVIRVISARIEGRMKQNAQNIERVKAQIDQQTETNIKARITEISQSQELESDELGYLYSVRAGFNADGCLHVMDVLGRMPGAQTNQVSHPAPERRSAQINALIAKYPPSTLKAEGKTKLDMSKPLGYEIFVSQGENGGEYSGLKILPRTGNTINSLDAIINQ